MLMSLKVPHPVAAYLAAEQAIDAEKLALCFAEDAVVHDEGRDHRGRKVIASSVTTRKKIWGQLLKAQNDI